MSRIGLMRLVVAAAAAGLLSACSSSVNPPASPDPAPTTPTATATAEPSPSPSVYESGRNPYESGAVLDWSIELDAEPELVTMDRQSSVVIVASTSGSMQTLSGYSLTSAGKTVPIWTYYLPTATRAVGLDASNGQVFLNVADGDQISDLVIVSARSGQETFRWSRSNPLDLDIPVVVGGYDRGVGVVKLERNSGIAAILDSEGRELAGDSYTFYPESGEDPVVSPDLVRVDEIAGVATYVTFPELGEVTGEACRSTIDGVVCLNSAPDSSPAAPGNSPGSGESADDSATRSPGASAASPEPSDRTDASAQPQGAALTERESSDGSPASPEQSDGSATPGEPSDASPASPGPSDGSPTSPAPASGQQVIVEWSRDGFPLRETAVTGVDPEMLQAVGLDADVTTRELASALADVPASATTVGSAPAPISSAASESEPASESEAAASEAAAGSAPTAGILMSDGDWLPESDWKISGTATVVPDAAPFVLAGPETELALTDVRTGNVLNTPGTSAVIGTGNASTMFFQWDGAELTYLKPNG